MRTISSILSLVLLLTLDTVLGTSEEEASLLNVALGKDFSTHEDLEEDKNVALQEVFNDDLDHGQTEDSNQRISSDQLESIFLDLDRDHDGTLNLEEFRQHYQEVLSGSSDFSSKDPIETKGLAAEKPSDDDVQLAWREFDTNQDGKVTAAEWSAVMFHEDPQAAQYVDGEDKQQGKGGDDEELTHRRILFREFDSDKSGALDRDEARALLSGTTPQESLESGQGGGGGAGGGGGGKGVVQLSKDEVDMILYQEFLTGEFY